MCVQLKKYDCCFAVSKGEVFTVEAENKEQAEIVAECLFDRGVIPDRTFSVDSFLNDVDEKE